MSDHSSSNELPGQTAPNEAVRALSHVRYAWIAAAASATVTLALVVAAGFGRGSYGIDSYSLIDVVLGLGLAYGIYRNSRVCAVLMLIYFVASKAYLYYETGRVPGALAFLFVACFVLGVRGTFAHHKATSRKFPTTEPGA